LSQDDRAESFEVELLLLLELVRSGSGAISSKAYEREKGSKQEDTNQAGKEYTHYADRVDAEPFVGHIRLISRIASMIQTRHKVRQRHVTKAVV
jgi:hypothetical protein